MPHMTEMICANTRCKKKFQARTADVNRGWGRFCSKSCKAVKQGRKLASKETRAMWREFSREESNRKTKEFYEQMDEHEAILDEMGETDDEKYGDSGLSYF